MHVVFGTGPVGRAAIAELNARGEPVRGVNRSGTAGVPEGVEVVAADASNPGAAAAAASGATAVYNCLNPPYDRWAEMFPPLQDSVVAAAQSEGARFVSFENLYMYGDTGGRPITEDLPYAAQTRKGKLRADMARSLETLSSSGDLELTTARASSYFGPGTTMQSPLGERVLGRVMQGKSAQVLGNPGLLHSYTYVPDAGRVLATIGTDARAVGNVWIVPNAPATSTDDIIAMMGRELDRDIKVSAAPDFVLKAMGVFNPIVRELPEMLYEFKQPFIADGSKFSTAFGIEATPLDQSVPETVAWWRDR